MRKNLEIVFDKNGVLAGFTNRFGGVSEGAFESLNLADHVGDDPLKVAQNREILATALGIMPVNLKFMSQIHSNRVEILQDFNDDLPPCDGVITSLKGVALCVLVADCAPVLIIDEHLGVVAAVHAGRAGVTSKICTNAVGLMTSEFGCRANNLRVLIGANIKVQNYEVGKLDLGEFNRYKKDGKFDINAALLDEFAKLGVEQIWLDPRCTFERDELFSYRKQSRTGRFCGFVMNRVASINTKK